MLQTTRRLADLLSSPIQTFSPAGPAAAGCWLFFLLVVSHFKEQERDFLFVVVIALQEAGRAALRSLARKRR
jgi:hypothetical protein